MHTCEISIYLAYLMIAYICTCIFYILMTRFIRTPFLSSLTMQQMEILNDSKRKRRNIFYLGCGISTLLLMYFHPLRTCIIEKNISESI